MIRWQWQWRHNGHDGVSNHQPHHYSLNRSVRHRSKNTSKLHGTDLCVTGEFPHKRPVMQKMFSLFWWRHHATFKMADLSRSRCISSANIITPHNGDVTWTSWRFQSPTTRLFVQHLVQVNVKENIAWHCWLFVRGIHRWQVHGPQSASNTVNVSMSWRHPGGGVTKAPFVNFSVSKIFDLTKVTVRFVETHSYLTGVPAAELRRHLSNINVISGR